MELRSFFFGSKLAQIHPKCVQSECIHLVFVLQYQTGSAEYYQATFLFQQPNQH